jgi:hypothetical protein
VLLEHGGPDMLIDHLGGPRPLSELLPDAFGPTIYAGSHVKNKPSDPVRIRRTHRHPDQARRRCAVGYRDRLGDRRLHPGSVHDEQMSALLMAIFLRGMTPGEIARWTAAMIGSGDRFDFHDLRRDGKPLALVDKHSTGGVGDKITIPWCPS